MSTLMRLVLSREFAVFLLCGGAAALVNLAVGALLYLGDPSAVPYVLAVGVAASCGLVVNFALNRLVTFPDAPRGNVANFRTFFIVAAIGTLLTALLAEMFRWTLVRVLGDATVNLAGRAIEIEFVAHVLAIGAVAVYSFLGHKFLSFHFGIRHAVGAAIAKGRR